ncbi:hypothetical protein FM042_09630 [Aliidiomarina halalkaliphila]|uniref:Uncharacterized protein n=1 Tax=Aliidiomarina halalkaliphila TaxID=2593535 RepID=A0A552X030_9GAMM|nr:hypothetical protein FM042_09630 [Aliidiomarina halalkaliphila]
MKKTRLIVSVLVVGIIARILVLYKTTGSDFSLADIFESLFFVTLFCVVFAVLFYRKEIKEIFSTDKEP